MTTVESDYDYAFDFLKKRIAELEAQIEEMYKDRDCGPRPPDRVDKEDDEFFLSRIAR